MSVKVQMNVQDIMFRRGLGTSNKARLMLADRVVALSDPYVPFDTGMLKNNHYIASDGSKISYNQKYAAYQWYGNFRNYSNQNGLRGGRWTDRMKQARGRELVKAVADYVGGKAR